MQLYYYTTNSSTVDDVSEAVMNKSRSHLTRVNIKCISREMESCNYETATARRQPAVGVVIVVIWWENARAEEWHASNDFGNRGGILLCTGRVEPAKSGDVWANLEMCLPRQILA